LAHPPPTALDAPYRFHAFEVSYFSAKVRPALRYKRLWHEEVRADLREIKKRTGLAFIPILITPEGETWQDSTDIFDRLEAHHPNPPIFPGTPLQTIAAHLIELYVDEFGLLPAMHYRWGSERGERTARARFCAMVGDVRLGNLAADRMVAARLALGATDETAPAIESHTKDLLEGLSDHFEKHDYLLGNRMSFADCALMGPVYGHFFNDLVSRELMLKEAVPVVSWIERCNHPDPDSEGNFFTDDEVSASLARILETMGRDAAPMILDGLEAFESWADQRPDGLDTVPRSVGQVETSLRGIPVTRFVGAYALWLIQRTLDAYDELEKHDRDRVDRALSGTGWETLIAYRPRHRLEKKGFELAFA
jgi:glutathione S-transferase